MKKNNSIRVAIIVIALTLITSCFVGTTFAKYTATITNDKDTARVAKFDVTAFGVTADAVADSATLDLWKIGDVYDSYVADGTFDYTTATPVADADIADSEYIIAPGSWGKFSFDVQNESEVTVTYKIDYTIDEKGVPLEWSIDGTTWNTDLADVTTPVTLAMEDDAATDADDETIDTITVYWRWVFGDPAANETDTALGFLGSAAPEITIAVTFEQVD